MTFQSQTQKNIVKSSKEKEKVYFAIAGARLTSSEAKPTSPSSACRRCQPTPIFYTLASFFMEFFSSFSGFPQSTMVSSRLFVPFPNVHLLLVLNLVGLVCLKFLKLSETRSNIILITKLLLQIL